MIDYIHKDLYWQDSIDKQLKIELEDGTILDNSMIYSEEFELEESLCSDDELRFGACEASCVKFRIFEIPNRLVGQKITISEVLGGQTDSPMQIGKYKIASAKPTADRDFIDIVAYDVMYDIIHSDVAAWYNNQFKATTSTATDEDGNETTVVTYSTTTLKKFRDSFFLHFGIDQADVTLPNDNMVVSKTIEIVPNEDGTIGETLSGSTVIEAICELNGCFGHINRNGKFEYVTLQPISKELFPADDLFPRNDLYPASDNTGVVIYNWQYEATEYEDFDVQPITQVQIIQEDNDIGMTVGSDGNKYVVNSNFLTYSLSDEELETVGTNLLSVIEKAKYTPIKANVIGNPCVTVGDIIKIVTNSAILYSYVINRSLKGCQSLTDEFESNGEEYRLVDVNSTSGQIKKLQGRSNVLERSIDETRSAITNVDRRLSTEIAQTAESITSIANATQSKWDTSEYDESKIYVGYEDVLDVIVTSEQKDYDYYLNSNTGILYIKYVWGVVEGGETTYAWTKFTYLSTVEHNLSSQIEQTAENITQTVSETYETKENANNMKTELQSQIEQTADSITSTVASAQSKWDEIDGNGNKVTVKQYGYGLDGSITGSYYVFSDTLVPGNIYLDQITGYAWKCTTYSDIDGKRIAILGSRPLYTFNLITNELSSQIEQTAESIVLKVDANGRIVEVSLNGDPKEGTEFTVDADNISLTASEVIDMLTNGEINLTGKHIIITSDNFNVDSEGNMSCENASITGEVNATSLNATKTLRLYVGTTFDKDYSDAVYADWGTGSSGDREIIVYSNIERFNKTIHAPNIYSDGVLYATDTIYTEGDIVSGLGNLSIHGTVASSSVSTTSLTAISDTNLNGDTKVTDWYNNTTGNGSNCHIGSEGRIRRVSSSSKRYKDEITEEISDELNPCNLYNTTIYQYKYKEGYLSDENPNKRKDRIGFIVEDLEKQYPIAIEYIKDKNGNEIPENWNDRYLIPPMLKLIQEQKQEIDTLKQQLATLTERMDKYEQGLQ